MIEIEPTSLIKKKVVTRWYVLGRGYSSRRRACHALATDNLRELIAGPWVTVGHWPYAYKAREREPVTREDWDTLAAEHFPHDESDDCKRLCRRVNQEYDGYGRLVCDGDYEFESCLAAQQKWVKEREDVYMSKVPK